MIPQTYNGCYLPDCTSQTCFSPPSPAQTRAALSFQLLRSKIPLFLFCAYYASVIPVYCTFKIHQDFSFSTSPTLAWYSITFHLDFHSSLPAVTFVLQSAPLRSHREPVTPESAHVTHLFKVCSCHSGQSKLSSVLLSIISLISSPAIPCLAHCTSATVSLLYLRNIRHAPPSRPLN